jgi:hypothetical protein
MRFQVAAGTGSDRQRRTEEMSDSEWMKGVKAALKKSGFSEDNNIALGMASAMLAGRDENSLSFDEGVETGSEAARRCKYGKR